MAMVAAPFDLRDLSAIPAFADLKLEELETVAASGKPRQLRRGEILVREGDASDALYFVVYGRFSVESEQAGLFAEIGQGQPIGEIGFFAGIPRTATVRALRDSQVLTITRECLRQIGDKIPRLRDAVIASLANRLAETIRVAKEPTQPRTIALVFAGDTAPSCQFLDLLRLVFGKRCNPVFLTQQVVEQRFGGLSLEDAAISAWLNALETDHDFIFYLADETPTDWTRKCVRQADLLLLVAAARAGRALNRSERLACSLHPPSARRLVVLHDARSDVAAGTRSWLEEREVLMHHHVSLQDTVDVERLFRFLAGRAVGFVAGGGGALGSAHLGVHKAMREIGVDFDIFGGTSVGAAMAAGLAAGLDAELVDAGTHNIFVKRRSFQRYALSSYALLNHKIFDAALRAEYGDITIEDLWKPYFAVSTNLSNNQIELHRRGPVWEAVRASGSIPALLPPFFTRLGEMLVDGGIVDNVPLGPMRSLKSGPNVIVALRPEPPVTYALDYRSIPGPWAALLARFNPFVRGKRPRVPNILQVVTLAMVANRRQDLALGPTDMLIAPALPANFQWTRWDSHTEVLTCAYRETAAALRRQLDNDDPCLSAMIAALR